MNARTKLIAAGALAAVAVLGLWFVLLWSPTKGRLDDAKAEKVASEQKRDQLQTRLAGLKVLEANKDRLEADKVLLAAAIPDKDKLDEFILQVNAKAAESKVAFVSISPAPPAAPAPGVAAAGGAPVGAPPSVGLQIQVTGDYFAILRFMDLLRDGERLVTVENFSLSEGGADGQMSASISGKMFLSSIPAAQPAA